MISRSPAPPSRRIQKMNSSRLRYQKSFSWDNNTLALKFTGKNQSVRAAVFYYAKVPGGRELARKKLLLGTQFEATDARRFFPCWDEPVFSRAFSAKRLSCLKTGWRFSNMPIASERKIGRWTRGQFPTDTFNVELLERLFAQVSLTRSNRKPKESSCVSLPRKGKKRRRRPLRLGKARRKFCAITTNISGFRIHCPSSINSPSRGDSAAPMENWGRNNLLRNGFVIRPAEFIRDERNRRVYEVIAHEVAHQWFGDLVTMAWWGQPLAE